MTLELELAVARGREYLARAVFRPRATVSIGTNPRAAVSLPEDVLPDYLDLLRLDAGGGWLSFEASTRLELMTAAGARDARSLIEGGGARETADGWEVAIGSGARGIVHFGDLRILLKLGAQKERTIWNSPIAEGAACGGCGAPLPWAVSGGGALTPCRGCGDLNRVEGDQAALEKGKTAVIPVMPQATAPRGPTATSARTVIMAATDARAASLPPAPPKPKPTPIAPRVGSPRGADLPTFDAIQVQKGQDLPTFDGIQARKGADLPTFDAIQVQKGQDLPTFDGIQIQKGQDLPTFDGLQVPRVPEPPLTNGGPRSRGSTASDASGQSDLPQFDAIQMVKRKEVLTTQAAMKAMRRERKPGAPNLAGEAPGYVMQDTGDIPSPHLSDDIRLPAQPIRLGTAPTPVMVPPEAQAEVRSLLQKAQEDETKDLTGPTHQRPITDPKVIEAARSSTASLSPLDDEPTHTDEPAPSAAVSPSVSADLFGEDPDPEAASDQWGRSGLTGVGDSLHGDFFETTPDPDPAGPTRDQYAAPDPGGPTRDQYPAPSAPDPAGPTRDQEPLPSPQLIREPPAPPPPPVLPHRTDPPTARHVPHGEDDSYSGDDFLMGRDDGGIGEGGTGWALIAFGVVSGAVGAALILYVALQ